MAPLQCVETTQAHVSAARMQPRLSLSPAPVLVRRPRFSGGTDYAAGEYSGCWATVWVRQYPLCVSVLVRPSATTVGACAAGLYGEWFAAAGIGPSVGAVGSSFDDALAEAINGLYKTELIKKRGPWRTVDQVVIATPEWVDWFNHRRLYEHCGDSRRPPWKPPTMLGPEPRKPQSSQANESPDMPWAVQNRTLVVSSRAGPGVTASHNKGALRGTSQRYTSAWSRLPGKGARSGRS